jgi:hypothetical protein
MDKKHYLSEVIEMGKENKQTKEQTVIFRAPKSAVRSLDRLAKLLGVRRSEALRRLIPDLTTKKEFKKCAS